MDPLVSSSLIQASALWVPSKCGTGHLDLVIQRTTWQALTHENHRILVSGDITNQVMPDCSYQQYHLWDPPVKMKPHCWEQRVWRQLIHRPSHSVPVVLLRTVLPGPSRQPWWLVQMLPLSHWEVQWKYIMEIWDLLWFTAPSDLHQNFKSTFGPTFETPRYHLTEPNRHMIV